MKDRKLDRVALDFVTLKWGTLKSWRMTGEQTWDKIPANNGVTVAPTPGGA
jgi:hypothetical protein